jgi:hypoxanthine phosphoribosyltransferase
MEADGNIDVVVGNKLYPTKPLLGAEAIRNRVHALAREIEAATSPDDELLVLVCLDGAMIFAADLLRDLARTTRLETIKLKSYQGTQSTGQISTDKPLPDDLAGKHVLIVEDIIDSGRTLRHLIGLVNTHNPASLRVAVLLDKPSAHIEVIHADHIGFTIGPRFVVGYGLDIDGRYRNIPYIAEVIIDT